MHIPEPFRIQNRSIIKEIIRSYSFGVLVSHQEGELQATHLPFVLVADPKSEKEELWFHVAGNNPHPEPGPGLIIFSGPHAYVSPSWYEEKNAVPTWNYVAIHAKGTIHAVKEPFEMRQLMARTVEEYEKIRPLPEGQASDATTGTSAWTIDWKNNYMERMLAGVRCFRMEIESLEGKAKLSQNHSQERQSKVIQRLSEGNAGEREVARLMKEMGGAGLPR